MESINDASRDKLEIEAIEDTISRASFMKRQQSNSRRQTKPGQIKQSVKMDNFFLNVIPTSQSPSKVKRGSSSNSGSEREEERKSQKEVTPKSMIEKNIL